ncbi:Flp family type IVb pilin [Ponticoccus alexandrii]|uniref:Flp family type IVb pilin n=1 Tax=Ponticoccus alexandrii TaxID=1943633 RepID=A0ABX7F6S2_9RHOB|nr:Flp family type IVb pilin [Ponticoccus alexandrii]MBN7787105.1 Flp family type IVb pilin [Enemella evansiae]QRF66088.1 Flp family type IVb pilin [Ponticoccus alexandrii]
MTLTRKTIKAFARSFSKDESGATAIEYGLFAALIGAVIVGTVATLGTQTNTGFTTLSEAMAGSGGTD